MTYAAAWYLGVPKVRQGDYRPLRIRLANNE